MTHTPAPLAPEAALDYIRGGHGRATLVGRTRRFTYKFSTPEGSSRPIFVGLLEGPDNEADYQYLGAIFEDPQTRRLALAAGWKGRPGTPAFTALDWWLKAAQYGRETGVVSQAQFWHEGICCRCGRALTTPESIAAGIGPVCATKPN